MEGPANSNMKQHKLPIPYTLNPCSIRITPNREHNHEEDYEREARRMEFLATQSFLDEKLNEKDEE